MHNDSFKRTGSYTLDERSTASRLDLREQITMLNRELTQQFELATEERTSRPDTPTSRHGVKLSVRSGGKLTIDSTRRSHGLIPT
ncbi:hypothetical protein PIB30_084557, partial [Stylosanthes scabra]|nr:hypothetical protein [Stylosanthes scabra]